LDRTLGSGKPVDPATRLSELLAQSLEELTRPFDPPRAAPGAVKASEPEPAPAAPAEPEEPKPEAPAAPAAEESRMDADKALAELEAELFAAAKQVDSETAAAEAGEGEGTQAGETETHEPAKAEEHATHNDEFSDDLRMSLDGPQTGEPEVKRAAPDVVPAAPFAAAEPAPAADADAARVIAKVRKLMLVSMAVTLIAVGSVFGFIGYRVYKGEGAVEKKADKLPEAVPVPNDVTLSLPRNAKIIQSAVANDRLMMTLEIDGKIEVRTFDVKTLQPTGRLNFSAAP
jgi:hypothetical protein